MLEHISRMGQEGQDHFVCSNYKSSTATMTMPLAVTILLYCGPPFSIILLFFILKR
ncbi:hypothetical protein [Fusobacterium ulcerans]|uniref:hypothetical protein n=1 Tax=Fusobacterium ulcerans TaxID=861 RepID=UPI0026ECE113|nr:hypothetical protein [Fusobacterium ulcerans]